MAASPSSTSSLLWRLFAVLALLLLLSVAYNGYQAYLHGDLSKRYYATNNYKTVLQDSLRRVVAAPRPVRTVVVYRPAPAARPLPGLTAADVAAAVRRELARQSPRPAAELKAAPPVAALKDTVVRRATASGLVVAKKARTATFRDKWLNLNGLVLPGPTGGADSLQVDYKIKSEFTVHAYSVREAKHWWQFWKGRQAYVDLENKNPHSVTSGLQKVKVNKR